MAYIEYARTPITLHYKGLNVHKVEALLVMPALSVVNDLKDYGVNACPLQCRVTPDLRWAEWFLEWLSDKR